MYTCQGTSSEGAKTRVPGFAQAGTRWSQLKCLRLKQLSPFFEAVAFFSTGRFRAFQRPKNRQIFESVGHSPTSEHLGG